MKEAIFERYRCDFEKAKACGCKEKGDILEYTYSFKDKPFEAIVQIDKNSVVSGKVIDTDFQDEFVAIRTNLPLGTYQAEVKEEYEQLLYALRDHCFIRVPFQSNQINRLIETMHLTPDFPFKKNPTYGVFRDERSRKWFGLVMSITKGQLEHTNDTTRIEVLNVKIDPSKYDAYMTRPSVYPCYHMNKTSWISVVLDADASDADIQQLIIDSKELVAPSVHAWIVPANPSYFDVDAAFRESENHELIWGQKNKVHVGDRVYIYMGAPISAIIYACEVREVDIDLGSPKEKGMCLRLKTTFKPSQYPFSYLKEYGVKAIRGPRSMPDALEKAIVDEN